MKIEEMYLEAQCMARDDKARRRSNLAPRSDAGITAEDIENGVTLEALQALPVPVKVYATQVTIHGSLPDIDDRGRVNGYKSLVKNANGSVGVRHVAIDAAKKKILVQCSHYSKTESKWSIHIDSQGCQAVASCRDKETALELMAAIPSDLFYGCKWAARTIYGSIVVVAEIGAIPADCLDGLCRTFTGITHADVPALKAAQDAEYEARRIASEQKRNEERERLAAIVSEVKAAFTPPQNWKRHEGAFTVGTYAFIASSMMTGKAELFSIKVFKKGPALCYQQRRATGMVFEDWKPEGKAKRFDSEKVARMNQREVWKIV